MKYIYDEETYPNMFLICFKDIESKGYYKFEISDRKNEIEQLYNFLSQDDIVLIGFNNLNFDYPVLHNTILKERRNWSAQEIYREAQNIIEAEYSAVRENEVKIPQIDLYRIWHYDNKNKATSLKWLEFAMLWDKLQDLPYKVGSVLTFEEMENVVSYCYNDVDATERFYYVSEKHIEIRTFYSELEGVDLMNASEIKMSKEIFSKALAKHMGISQWDVKKLRTFRKSVDIKDIIFPYIKFNDPGNQDALAQFERFKWIDTSNMTKAEAKKHSLSFSAKYKNVTREFAEGGLHSFGKAGIYESDDDYVLVDVDFKVE
ncbi:putative DNA polymerase [Cellulophaga phage phi14:2]|uniref:Putative DNA polymerase n=1 Tax=Cellulophaga phage phi14:2 TaxID=1327990 RepID=S0A384_9CAUD|nr:putative DNA polymerase [Cellulophaga phage phi14:2]